MKSTVSSEVDRATEYIEASFENLRQKIGEVVGKGLSYDLEILLNGQPVHQVPVVITGVITVILTAPPMRLASLIAVTAASYKGYSFRIVPKKETNEVKKK